ncbi:DNA-binding response regulator [Oleiphilus sp. HI0072]|nr:DNA-binding response regulator [Oleiphilus sp. HI0072]
MREQLADALKQQSYCLELAADGEEGLYKGMEFPIDLAVVDLGLPKIEGVEVIRRWRKAGRDFPILILTARGNWQDKVEGLDAGADDYLVKPFHVEELFARIKALLRRFGGQASSVLKFETLTIDLSAKQATVNDSAIDLTAFEFNILEYLLLNSERPVSKAELTEHLYEQDYDRDSNVIEVLVGRLRKKLETACKLSLIKTVRGQGYRFLHPSE